MDKLWDNNWDSGHRCPSKNRDTVKDASVVCEYPERPYGEKWWANVAQCRGCLIWYITTIARGDIAGKVYVGKDVREIIGTDSMFEDPYIIARLLIKHFCPELLPLWERESNRRKLEREISAILEVESVL